MERRKESVILTLGAANFLAALGGGTVLSVALDVVKDEPIKGASVLPLVAGTALGFFVLLGVRTWEGRHRGALFSMATAALSFALYMAWPATASADGKVTLDTTTAWIVLAAFICRWATFYVSRSLRAEAAGFYSGQIPIVECLLFLGFMAGLLAWRALHAGFAVTLSVDALLQTAAAGLDIVAARQLRRSMHAAARPDEGTTPAPAAFDIDEFWRVAIAAATMTAGLQMAIFAFAEALADRGQPALASSALAAFYGAGALAAGLCGWMQITFFRNASSRFDVGWVRAASGRGWRVPLLALTVGATAFTFGLLSSSTEGSSAFVLALVVMATFCLATTTMTLLSHGASLAKQAGQHGRTALAYGVMGLIATAALWCLTRWPATWRGAVVLALAITTLALTRPFRSARGTTERQNAA
jgi:hypothetical protein